MQSLVSPGLWDILFSESVSEIAFYQAVTWTSLWAPDMTWEWRNYADEAQRNTWKKIAGFTQIVIHFLLMFNFSNNCM